MVNEEVTAEEWKRRFEKEREKTARLKGLLARAEFELEKWRSGETVSAEEQVKLVVNQLDFENNGTAALSAEGLCKMTTSTSDLLLLNMADSKPLQLHADQSAALKDEWEREKTALYTQLDEKDDEINNQSQLCEKYNLQLNDQEELINSLRKDNDDLLGRIASLESETESQREEIKEVLKALEEVAVNFEQKQQEAESKSRENESLSNELDRKLTTLKSIEDELDTLKEVAGTQRKRILDMMMTLLKDLAEIGHCVGGVMSASEFKKPSMDSFENAEEDFTMARLYVSKLKGEIKLLTQKCAILDEHKCDAERVFDAKNKELEELSLNLVQNEARLKSQQDYSKDLELKKRKLEEELDATREESAKIKAQQQQQQQSNGSAESNSNSSNNGSSTLSEQLEIHVESLKKQMKELRDENDANQKKCHEMADQNQNIKLAHEKLKNDYDKLRKDEADRSLRLAELVSQQEMREQAKQDLKGLEETVAKELQSLHNLRKLFVQDLQARLKKSQKQSDSSSSQNVVNEAADGDDLTNGNIAQKQKIAFLENNLEQLTKVHKQLVRDNADLRCELPKLEKRLKATVERVKALEVALKEAKEGAMKDRKRYQHEVERIKEAVRQRSLIKKGSVPNIVKPIRAGQQPIPTIQGGNSSVIAPKSKHDDSL
jgi:kinesin family protein 5